MKHLVHLTMRCRKCDAQVEDYADVSLALAAKHNVVLKRAARELANAMLDHLQRGCPPEHHGNK